jgi:Holliday junction resolvase
MVNSIVKGKNFEREVAKILSVITRCDWQRVPMSGAFSTNNNSEDPRFSGDVFTENKEYENFVIECKSYATLEISELFNNNSKFYGWIKQAKEESKGKPWILFIKIKNKGVYVLSETYNKIIKQFTDVFNFIMVDKKIFIKIK